MKQINLGSNPESFLDHEFDCLWVCFQKRTRASPVEGLGLEWIDWKLQGLLSRHLKKRKKGEKEPTYVSTSGKLNLRYLVLDAADKPDLKRLSENLNGLKLKKVLVYMEDPEVAEGVFKEMKHQKSNLPSDQVFFAMPENAR